MSNEINATPSAIEFAAENGVDLSTVEGTGAEGRIGKGDVQKAIDAAKAAAESAGASASDSGDGSDEGAKTTGDSSDEFDVEDPEELRPAELPLVVKPKKGESWKNEEQEEYAATLNGYAYRNPKKWNAKKGVLLARLAEIGKDPEAIAKFRGNEGRLSFKNKLIEN